MKVSQRKKNMLDSWRARETKEMLSRKDVQAFLGCSHAKAEEFLRGIPPFDFGAKGRGRTYLYHITDVVDGIIAGGIKEPPP